MTIRKSAAEPGATESQGKDWASGLFENGIGQMHFRQGQLSSCQTLSVIYALSRHPLGCELLSGMVEAQSEEHFRVRFPGYPAHAISIYQHELEMPGDDRPVNGDVGLRLLELAYARLNRLRFPQQFPGEDCLSVYQSPHFHYHPGHSLSDFTGKPFHTMLADGGQVFEASGSFETEGRKNYQLIEHTRAYLRRLADEFGQYAIIASSYGQPGSAPEDSYLDPEKTIFGWHDHAMAAIDPAGQRITLIDPYNTRSPLVLGYQAFFRYFNGLTVARLTD